MKICDYLKQFFFCSVFVFLAACEKYDTLSILQPGDDINTSSVTVMRNTLVTPDTLDCCDTLAHSHAARINSGNCGCVPNFTCTMTNGVPVLNIPLSQMSTCNEFKLSYTINGTSSVDYGVITTPTSCPLTLPNPSPTEPTTISVTLQCNRFICKGYFPSACMNVINFTFQPSGGEGEHLKGCQKRLSIPMVAYPTRGTVIVDIPSPPSPTGNMMNPDSYIIYWTDGVLNDQRYGGNVSSGKNEINYYASGNGSYWIKLYNEALCNTPGEHYAYFNLTSTSPNFYMATEVNQHSF